MRIAAQIPSVVLLAVGIWFTVGALARGYMVASGTVQPGEVIYANEIAPTLKDDAIAAAEGLVMLALGSALLAKSKRPGK